MEKSPGHRKWPDHTVDEEHFDGEMRVLANGEVIADSRDVIELIEDGHPDRYDFPRSDVDMNKLENAERSTECPFKGTGRYFNVKSDEGRLKEVAWSYEDTYEEHRALEDRIAFHDEETEAIELAPVSAA
ncbi:MAG: DUF427 domain-containing protein [Gemmatimonadetes bacterium]|nr:DUF427 domain-containing protein [Gemmatimonadota bacterium]